MFSKRSIAGALAVTFMLPAALFDQPGGHLARHRTTLLARSMARIWCWAVLAVIANRLCLGLWLKPGRFPTSREGGRSVFGSGTLVVGPDGKSTDALALQVILTNVPY